MKTASCILITCLIALCAGCGGGGSGGGEAPSTADIPTVTQDVDGSAGGTVLSSGYGVSFEPGALDGDARVTVRESETPLDLSMLEFAGTSPTLEISIEVEVEDGASAKAARFSTSATTLLFPHEGKGDVAYVVLWNKLTGAHRIVEAASNGLQNAITATTEIAVTGYHWLARVVYHRAPGEARLYDFASSMTDSNERILVLIHGLRSDADAFKDAEGGERSFYEVADEGLYAGRVLRYEYAYLDSIALNADRLFALLDEKIFQLNPTIQVDLVGHSMGGLLARKFTIDHPEKVGSLVTLGSPHLGAPLADYLDDIVNKRTIANEIRALLSGVSIYSQGVRDLEPGSAFLNAMNGSDTPLTRPIRYLTVHGTASPTGDWVVPSASADMTHDSFPLTHENIGGVESYAVDAGHTALTKDHDDLFEVVSEFLGFIAVPYMASPGIAIDGTVGPSEWGGSFSATDVLVSGVGDLPIRCDIRLVHDGSFLYVALSTPLSDGWDAKGRLRFDGDDSGTLSAFATAPYIDVSIEERAPSAASLYHNYLALLDTTSYNHVPPGPGEQRSSSGSASVSYEYRVPLSDLDAARGDTVRMAITASSDGYDMWYWPMLDSATGIAQAPVHPVRWAKLELE